MLEKMEELEEKGCEMTAGHEEYQQVIREVLAPTLDFKKKWVMLKKRLDNYSAKIHSENDGPCTGEFRAGFDRALGWVDSEIEKLEAD